MPQPLKSLLARLGLLPLAHRLQSLILRNTPKRLAKARRAQARQHRLEQLYSYWVKPGGLCFDIGANVGVRVEMFRRLGAKVIAAEPHELCLEMLREKFDGDPKVVLIPAGLGAEQGEHELFVSNDIQTSSMSRQWIDSVSDRLDSYTWQERRIVTITTLDALIQAHGLPTFCKIDVEGFEHEVLKGLSAPIPCLSFEYTPEILEPTFACIDRLAEIGSYELNYSEQEDFELAHEQWLQADALKSQLDTLRTSGRSGDIYARLRSPEQP